MSVEAVEVVHSFRGKEVLHGVSLEVKSGELVALLGPSGCGKTTLLRSIAGLIQPDSGRIVIEGQDVTEVEPRKRSIGMVFQSYALFPNLKAWENVGFALTLRGEKKDRIRERAHELLGLVGLPQHADHFPKELSGGQQQRVALARALAREPNVLLLDEPLSALDAKIRSTLRDEIRRIQQQTGITSLYVTHDQAEALAIADRVVLMSEGRIEQCSSPLEIYSSPVSRFAAEFVGSQNMVAASVAGGEARWLAVTCGYPGETPGDAAPVTMMFRPEDVRVASDGSLPMRGKVELTTFLGATTRVGIKTSETPDFAAELIEADLDTYDAAGLSVGDEVTFEVRTENVRAFAD